MSRAVHATMSASAGTMSAVVGESAIVTCARVAASMAASRTACQSGGGGGECDCS